MSPRLEMPLNRREALTAVLAMLAIGMSAGGAFEDAEASPEAVRAASIPQPHPGSERSWHCDMQIAADEHHLPIPRNPDLESQLTIDGQTLRLEVVLPPDPVWIDDVEQDPTPLGSFIFTGDAAPFLDALSAEGDRVWLKKEMEEVQRTST